MHLRSLDTYFFSAQGFINIVVISSVGFDLHTEYLLKKGLMAESSVAFWLMCLSAAQ